MHVVAIIVAAALGAGVGTLLPLPTYRLSVPAGSVPAAECRQCLLPLPAGVRGWIGWGTCPFCASPLTSLRWCYVVVTAVAFAGLAWRLPHGSPAQILLLAAWLLFAAAGVWLAAIDLNVHRPPRRSSLGLPSPAGCCSPPRWSATSQGSRLPPGSPRWCLGWSTWRWRCSYPGSSG